MSIHPSLAISLKDKKQRSVLKRIERVKILKDKGQWQEENPVFGLPKVKTLRIKIKKEKAAEKATTEAALPAEQAAAPTATAETKPVAKTAAPPKASGPTKPAK